MSRGLAALGIRPGETATALRLLALMVVLFVGFTLGSNAVESLLLARVGANVLPYLYVALGPVTCVVVSSASGVLARGRSALGPVFLAVAGVVAAARALLLVGGDAVYAALWIVMMILWTIAVFNAWAVAGVVHDARQAKRLYPLYGAGIITGIVLGGAITGPLASSVGTENLFVPWGVATVAAWWLTRSVLSAGPPAAAAVRERRGGPGLRAGYRAVRATPLLRWMAVSLALLALLYFAVSFVFARAVAARYPRAAELAGFLGIFIGTASGVALLVSLLVANRLFARFGVATMVLVLPALYALGFAVLAVSVAFLAVAAFRFGQIVWVNGVWGSGWQALFNVVPAGRRAAVRSFMDAFPLQAGIVAAGGLLILAERGLTPRQVSVAGAAGALVTLVAVARARRAYGEALAEALREGNPDVFAARERAVGGALSDGAAIAALASGAADPDPGVRRLALELLADAGAAEAPAALARGAADPEPQVRETSVRALARMDAAVAREVLARALADPVAAVRAAAARAAVGAAGEATGEAVAEALRGALRDPEPEVRFAAAAALAATGDREARAVLLASGGAEDPVERAAGLNGLAVAMGPSVSVGELAREIPVIVPALGDPEGRVRRAAVAALAAAGSSAIGPVGRALEDPRLEDGALEALLGLFDADPDLLRRYAEGRSRRALRYVTLRRGTAADGDERLALLHDALDERARADGTRALRALTAGADSETITLALENLESGHPDQRANALEILEAAAEGTLVRPLLVVWEPPPSTGQVVTTLARVLEDHEEDPWVRACAALAAGALDDEALTGVLDRVAGSDSDPLVRETAAAARRGNAGMETLATLSLMERVLFLRKVPLFAGLAPSELRAVAEVCTEQVFGAGAALARQGEEGEELHIVVSGAIRVTVAAGGAEHEVAVRRAGEYVGEMAIVSRAPRMASLAAVGDVRVLSIDRRRFERILRDRPEVGLAVMRVLADRLRESDAARGPAEGAG